MTKIALSQRQAAQAALELPKALRLHIGLFGKRNAGKSSLINRLTGQNLSIVSDIPGTTTDPVEKSCELHPVGPVVFIDTAGIDDTGELGALRVGRSLSVMQWVDLALVVIDAAAGISADDENLLASIRTRGSRQLQSSTRPTGFPMRQPPHSRVPQRLQTLVPCPSRA